MTENIAWPVGWSVNQENLAGTHYSVHIDNDHYGIYRSGGNEQLWYVVQYWIGEPEASNTDITGQCTTLAEAVESLAQFLRGDFVASGDEIIVRVGEKSTGYMPIFHNSSGEKYVAIPEVI